jgi:hypothetical protein
MLHRVRARIIRPQDVQNGDLLTRPPEPAETGSDPIAYVEPLNDARTKPAHFFNILLVLIRGSRFTFAHREALTLHTIFFSGPCS